ncbi:hypothetical protein HGI30_03900 [Paenibacillus albicereus]|uniref:Uncharacterized protein n=1 Tax=Paenibacillus albicereus TaxID=2726185 RepID=A0A6H2GTN6_9BACL|nr:hypothetical protein [Paenibacillus albicereus]QJC50793.1 hypothetical protein HGI30_03900 [Paenibacillus albicereus]
MLGSVLMLFWLLVAIVILASLYAQREREEEWLFLKLIGYYLLGGFVLFLSVLPVPLGFILYWLLLHGKARSNRAVKESAAFWGLGVLLIRLVIGLIF